MPASPIIKKLDVIPNNWVHLQKTIIPDQFTGCYWSVWYNLEEVYDFNAHKVTAHLMWCPIGDDPTINDTWSHAEEITGDCKNVLDTIEAVYGISFHESIWVEMGAGNKLPSE